jgi:hypothetical protein
VAGDGKDCVFHVLVALDFCVISRAPRWRYGWIF